MHNKLLNGLTPAQFLQRRWQKKPLLARDSLPVIGLLWNPRVLPFLYLVRLLLCMVGIVDTVKTTCTGVEMFRKLLDQGHLYTIDCPPSKPRLL